MAGNIYKLTLRLSDGSTVDAGTFTAPQGPQGDAYVLTDSDKEVIAEEAAAASGNGMPVIRFCNARDYNGTMVITDENPLSITVEIVGGGELQVGDRLEVCERKLATYNSGTIRKYRLRRFMERAITAGDLVDGQPRWLTVVWSSMIDRRGRLFHNGYTGQGYGPLYIRIRRPVFHAVNLTEINGLFSNVVSIGRSSGKLDDGRLRIHIR